MTELFTFGNLFTLVTCVIGISFGYGMLSQRVKTLENQIVILEQVNAKLTAIQGQLMASSATERPVSACRNYFDIHFDTFKSSMSDTIELTIRREFEKIANQRGDK